MFSVEEAGVTWEGSRGGPRSDVFFLGSGSIAGDAEALGRVCEFNRGRQVIYFIPLGETSCLLNEAWAMDQGFPDANCELKRLFLSYKIADTVQTRQLIHFMSLISNELCV